jgi:hypothetical protein
MCCFRELQQCYEFLRQCYTLQTIMASFHMLMVSFCGVAIYTHTTSPGHAADIQNIANPFQSLVKLSLTPLFVRVSD